MDYYDDLEQRIAHHHRLGFHPNEMVLIYLVTGSNLMAKTRNTKLIDRNNNLTYHGKNILEHYLKILDAEFPNGSMFADELRIMKPERREQLKNPDSEVVSRQIEFGIMSIVYTLNNEIRLCRQKRRSEYEKKMGIEYKPRPFEKSEENLIKIATENNCKPAYLYIALSCYCLKKSPLYKKNHPATLDKPSKSCSRYI